MNADCSTPVAACGCSLCDNDNSSDRRIRSIQSGIGRRDGAGLGVQRIGDHVRCAHRGGESLGRAPPAAGLLPLTAHHSDGCQRGVRGSELGGIPQGFEDVDRGAGGLQRFFAPAQMQQCKGVPAQRLALLAAITQLTPQAERVLVGVGRQRDRILQCGLLREPAVQLSLSLEVGVVSESQRAFVLRGRLPMRCQRDRSPRRPGGVQQYGGPSPAPSA